jgi:hypothetical protein
MLRIVPMEGAPNQLQGTAMDSPASDRATSQADLAAMPVARCKKSQPSEQMCRTLAEKAFLEFGKVPATQKFELYLVRGIGSSGGHEAVIFQPEFLFLLDVGFENLIGVSVPWHTKGLDK